MPGIEPGVSWLAVFLFSDRVVFCVRLLYPTEAVMSQECRWKIIERKLMAIPSFGSTSRKILFKNFSGFYFGSNVRHPYDAESLLYLLLFVFWILVTTNFFLNELRAPSDTAHARVYVRVLELCILISSPARVCTAPTSGRRWGGSRQWCSIIQFEKDNNVL